MKLLRDDKLQVYVWVDEDEKIHLSPHFDYEEDADLWYNRMVEHIIDKHCNCDSDDWK